MNEFLLESSTGDTALLVEGYASYQEICSGVQVACKYKGYCYLGDLYSGRLLTHRNNYSRVALTRGT